MTADRKSKTPSTAPLTPVSIGTPGSLDGKPHWPAPGDGSSSRNKPQDSASVATGLSSATVVVEKKPSLWRRFRSCLGHFAIFFLLAVYTAAGGFAFHYIEHPVEVEDAATLRELYKNGRREIFEFVVNVSQGRVPPTVNDDDGDNELEDAPTLQEIIDVELDKFQEVLMEVFDGGIALDNETHEWQWTFSSSFFFASTVVTTIGYGNIAPVTFWGRFFCIVFALFGIPLTLIAIGDLGKLFASSVQAIGKNVRKCLCGKKAKKKKNKKKNQKGDKNKDGDDDDEDDADDDEGNVGMSQTWLRVIGAIALLLVYISIGGALFMLWENWTFFNSFYFCFITMTTIGLGDVVPEHQMFMLLCTVYILIGLAVTSTCIELARAEYERGWQKMLEASRKLHISNVMAETLRKLNEQLETHGEIVDMSVLHDLRSALRDSMIDDGGHVPGTPPVYVIYETSV